MPSTFRASSVDRLSAFFGSSDRKAERNDDLARPMPGRRRRSSSINRLTAFLLNSDSKSNPMTECASNNSAQDQQIRGRTPSRRLSKSRPPSLTRSPISDFSSSRSSAYPPSSFRMPNERRMSTNSILDTLDPPQPTFIDDTVSRSSSPSTGWRPRSRAGSTSRPASRMSMMPSSTPASRPVSPSLEPEGSAKKTKRRSLFFGGPRSKIKTRQDTRPPAWVAGSGLNPENVPYDLTALVGAEHVPELWDDRGDTLVYLFPRTSDKGPSFKIRSSLFASSKLLTHLAYAGRPSRPDATRKRISRPPQLAAKILDFGKPTLQTPPHTPKLGGLESPGSTPSEELADSEQDVEDYPGQISLYLPVTLSTDGALISSHSEDLPLTEEDVDKLIAIRNLFAFLVGGALVATARRHSIFSIFLNVARLLERYQFTNLDSTTFGEVASTSFDCYVDELDLADMRGSCDKIIEALVLGEKMKSTLLYDEAFTHYVGRYEDVQDLAKQPTSATKLALLSRPTKLRAERAYIDLKQRIDIANVRLNEFEFPSLFEGSRITPFKDSFRSARRCVLTYYKAKYGSWPPKADWKKNELTKSGLNRLVLQDLYKDFADMYDLYVDRNSLTTLAINQAMEDAVDNSDEPLAQRLRSIFDDYNRSLPPVMPPIPFDMPLLPSLAGSRREYGQDATQDAKLRSKKLKDDGVLAVLGASRNSDIAPNHSPFLTAICKFERKEARGKSINDLVNLRAGLWLFMYVVIQALPMLAIDAPGVRRHHEGIEYFLCMPPRKGVPWATDTEGSGRGRHSMAWYGIAGGSGMVELPSDLIEHGVEGIYRRSHCWLMAQKWSIAALANIQDTPRETGLETNQERRGRSYTESRLFRDGTPPYSNFPLPPAPVLGESVTGAPGVVSNTPLMTPLASPTASSPSATNKKSLTPVQLSESPAEPRRRTRQDAMRESVFALGLEQLPMPPSLVSPMSSYRAESPLRPGLGSPSHSAATTLTRKTSMTFDDILTGMEKDKKGKKARPSK